MEFVSQSRILIVDDDEGCRGLLQECLAPMGCRVTAAADGREALDRLAHGEWDVVLLDLHLPGVSGFSILDRIRERWTMDRLPVLMITGQDDAETRGEALARLANDFLPKPIHPAELMARVGTILSMVRARQEAEAHVRELEEARQLRDLLVHCCIHDLRGPLTSARGFVEIAMDRMPADADAIRTTAQLRHALDAIDRAVAMASDVIDVAKMEEGRFTTRREPVETGALVSARAEGLRGIAGRRGVALDAGVPGEPVVALADRSLLERVLDNLVTNALKHTPAGGRVTVTADLAGPAGPVRIAVRDTGEGIPREWHQRIFDKFSQVEMRQHGFRHDSGLGLAFCRLAVEGMGGTIQLDSEPGAGSTFTLLLPAVPRAERATMPANGTARALPAPQSARTAVALREPALG